MSFQELGLSAHLLQVLSELNYKEPTPIQRESIPEVLAKQDILACAQTGTGKTAAFTLPILQMLTQNSERISKVRAPRTLVLTPTRELAMQVYESFCTYGKNSNLNGTLIVGGESEYHQVRQIKSHPDFIVATPGRLIDLAQRNLINLSLIEYLVLDEADHMLDMGFLPSVRRIVQKTPKSRQTLLFSATFPKKIEELAQEMLKKPKRISIAKPKTASVESIQQLVYKVEQPLKTHLLTKLLEDSSMEKVIVFTRTKHRADKLCKLLTPQKISCAPIHSNRSQAARKRALEQFKEGTIRVLVASDIVSRGIDVEEITHVVNYDMPETPETYVHRIGRTGRASATGHAFSFCSGEEVKRLKDIERLTKKQIKHGTLPELPLIQLNPTPQLQKQPQKSFHQPGKNFNKR